MSQSICFKNWGEICPVFIIQLNLLSAGVLEYSVFSGPFYKSSRWIELRKLGAGKKLWGIEGWGVLAERRRSPACKSLLQTDPCRSGKSTRIQ